MFFTLTLFTAKWMDLFKCWRLRITAASRDIGWLGFSGSGFHHQHMAHARVAPTTQHLRVSCLHRLCPPVLLHHHPR